MKIINTAIWVTMLGATTYYTYLSSKTFRKNIEETTNFDKIKWLALTGAIAYGSYLTAVEVRNNIVTEKSPMQFIREKTQSNNSLVNELNNNS